MTYLRIIPLITLAALTTGCVSAKKHNALAADYNNLQVEHSEISEENRRAEIRMAYLESRLSDLAETEAELVSFYWDIINDLRPLIDSGAAEVVVHDGRIQLALSHDVLFDTAEASLSEEGRRTARTLAKLMQRNNDQEFQIEGHTDPRPINTPEYENNWELGAERAIALTEALIDNGVEEGRLSAASFADTQPIASNATPASMSRNRRVDIVVVPDIRMLPEIEKMLQEFDAIEQAAASR